MLEIFSRGRDPEVKGYDITVVVAVVRKKETTRWMMRRCASRMCNNHAHHKRNVVRHVYRMPDLVVVGGEEVNQSGSISDS